MGEVKKGNFKASARAVEKDTDEVLAEMPQELLERPPLPDALRGTEVYPLITEAALLPVKCKEVPDVTIGGGGTRRRRYGMYLCISLIPDFDKQNSMLLPVPPAVLIDGDTPEEIKDRVLHEMDIMIDTTKKMMEYQKTHGPSNSSSER